jgi:hypothetical protein
MAMRIAGDEEGNGKGSKIDGNGYEGGRQATATIAKATATATATTRAMATATGW